MLSDHVKAQQTYTYLVDNRRESMQHVYIDSEVQGVTKIRIQIFT